MSGNSQKPRWIKIGIVGKAHGLRGAFFVRDREDEIPPTYDEIVIGKPGPRPALCKILETRKQGNGILLRVEGVDTREQVEAQIGQDLWVSREKAVVQEDEFLWADFTGRKVVDVHGSELGVASSIYNVGASDNLVITGKAGSLDLPLVATYVDFEATEESEHIVLGVPEDTFADLWTPARGSKK